jgi:hypothetical protein
MQDSAERSLRMAGSVSFLGRLLPRTSRTSKADRLQLEPLEPRSLPSATSLLGLLDGVDLLGDPMFASAVSGTPASVASHAAPAAAGAPTAATPVVGSSVNQVVTATTPPPAAPAHPQAGPSPLVDVSGNPPVYAVLVATTKDAQGNPETYFTDGNNQLWRTDNGVSVQFAAFATRLVAGQGIALFTDGSNHLYLFSDATNSFTDVGAYATRIAGGTGPFGTVFFFTDGTDQLWSYNAANGSMTSTGAYATRISLGFDAANNVDVWFTDGSNRVWLYHQGTFTNTGAFANLLSGGLSQLAFTDGSNRVFLYSAVTNTFIDTGAYAIRLSGRANSNGSAFAFTDADNHLYSLGGDGVLINTGAFALRINVGQDTSGNPYIWFVDGNNVAWIWSNNWARLAPGNTLYEILPGPPNG